MKKFFKYYVNDLEATQEEFSGMLAEVTFNGGEYHSSNWSRLTGNELYTYITIKTSFKFISKEYADFSY